MGPDESTTTTEPSAERQYASIVAEYRPKLERLTSSPCMLDCVPDAVGEWQDFTAEMLSVDGSPGEVERLVDDLRGVEDAFYARLKRARDCLGVNEEVECMTEMMELRIFLAEQAEALSAWDPWM